MLGYESGTFAQMTYNQHPHYNQQQQPQQSNFDCGSSGFYQKYGGKEQTMSNSSRISHRAQLLAGLRTAQKPNGSLLDHQSPTSVPDTGYQTRSGRGLFTSTHLSASHSPPQQQRQHAGNGKISPCGLPTPPSASPERSLVNDNSDYEARVYAELLAHNLYLAQQQQILQQQLRNVQQAQQNQYQYPNYQLQSPAAYSTPPVSPAYFGNNMVSPQSSLYYGVAAGKAANNDGSAMNTMQSLPVVAKPYEEDDKNNNAYTVPPQQPPKHQYYQQHSSAERERSASPEKPKYSQQASDDVREKEKPFKRGHKKCNSLSSCVKANTLVLSDNGPKTSLPKTGNTFLPTTPLQSTFGGRGDHPTRQPRGPPSLEEIVSRPTSKHEGSKNFATRQRRKALSKLVNAGMERRVARSTSSNGGSMTPVSETEIALNFEDSDSVSSTQSASDMLQSLNLDCSYGSAGSQSSENSPRRERVETRALRPRQSNLLSGVLSAAEKRKSALF